MSANVVAHRYARALLAAVDATDTDPEPVIEEVRTWADWIAGETDGAIALRSPVVAPDHQAAFLDRLIEEDDTSGITANFLRLALSKGRIGLLPVVLEQLQTLLDERAGQIRGEAASARPLDDDLRGEIETKLKDHIDLEPILTWREDPDLLGGFRVTVANRTLDASLKVQLERLGETIRKEVR